MSNSQAGYKIGKVSKMTGIATDTLRIWERRYAAVTPTRSEAGGRLYAAHEIERLKLIKALVDNGDSIGNIATLTLDELENRISETRAVSAPGRNAQALRLIVVGRSIPGKIERDREAMKDLILVSSYPDIQALNAESELLKADILVIEQSTLQQESATQVADLINQVNAAHAVIIYRFAAKDTLERIPKSRFSTLRAPVEIKMLSEHCHSLQRNPLPPAETDTKKINSHAPPRRYDDAALAKIGAISPTIACECPHHLAELLASLAAFERYSSECESRDLKDAELHAYLGKSASHARHLIEDALEMVIQIEDIQL